MDLPEFEQIEQLIKNAQLTQAKALIRKISANKRGRVEQLQFAKLARRAGLAELTLKVLSPYVRESKNASSGESCEYAIALIKNGYYDEGSRLLQTSDSRKNSEIQLYLAFAQIYQWNYEQAQVHLSEYLKLNLTPYERLVAQVNYSASLIFTGQPKDKILSTLNEVTEDTKKLAAPRLRVNALELKAHTYVLSKEFAAAEKCLTEAEGLLDVNTSFDGLFIKKWRALCQLRKLPESAEARRGVLKVRNEAHQMSHWETARDCDYYLGIWHRNRSVLSHLYFGTPYPAYRQRILTESHGKFEIGTSYLWRLNSRLRPEKYFDLRSGQDDSGKDRLEPHQQSVRLLKALASDFYRPRRVSDLVTQIFPGEFYDPFSTHNRLHQAMARLRQDLKASRLPFEVLERKGFYLNTKTDFGILIYEGVDQDVDLAKLKSVVKAREFTAREAEAALGWPRRTVQDWISKKVITGAIIKTGAGPTTRYTLA